jgi:cell division protein FtsI (penicillin-binding protein 3)
VKGSKVQEKNIGKTMPDLRGMGLKDVIFLMEGMGLQVEAIGSGKVIKQSVPVGRRIKEGSIVKIRLT